MRVLFSTVPGFGHILPIAPLMAAAIQQSHQVAFLSTEANRSIAATELPAGVEFLPAGVPAEEFFATAAERGGEDPFHPTWAMVAGMFGATRLEVDGAAALAAARAWQPDAVVADSYDSVGPMVGAALGVPWHQLGLGPGIEPGLVAEIDRAVAPWYDRADLTPVPATTYLDPCPPVLHPPGWTAPAPVQRIRNRAHSRPATLPAGLGDLARSERPTVLLTLGTVASGEDLAAALAEAVTGADAAVVATRPAGASRPELTPGSGDVRWVDFVPLDHLLTRVDLVVAAGGSGTVLGALTRGVPMVLFPQGADQPITAARAEAAGVALVVQAVDEITVAVKAALADPSLRARARELAAGIAADPSPATVAAHLFAARG